MNKKARDNRANQLNPNNPAYWKSRQGNKKKSSGGSNNQSKSVTTRKSNSVNTSRSNTVNAIVLHQVEYKVNVVAPERRRGFLFWKK